MKKNLITKLALGVAIAAMLFSIVTLIRSLIIGSGVLMSSILVVGTTIIVAICAIMLYVLSNYEAAEDEDDDEADEDGSDEAAGDDADSKEAAETLHKEHEIEQEVDELIADIEKQDKYDLHNFE